METIIEKALFAIVYSAVSGKEMSEDEKALISEDVIETVTKLAAMHDIAQLVALGLKNNGLLNEQTMLSFQKVIYTSVCRDEKIKHEFGKICEILERQEIEYIPLKGSVIREFYPETWMRMSCDIDILVREEDLKRAKKALVSSLGYRANGRMDYHDISLFSSNGVHLELHFSIKEDMDNIDKLLDKVWKYASRKEKNGGYCCCMTPEFFVFHQVCHMAHHFVHGGCGIKPFVDMYVLRQRYQYDDIKLRRMLKECGIEEFYDNMLYMTDVWFGDKPHNTLSKTVEEYILRGGVYGSLENKVTIAKGKKGSRSKYALSRIFISYDELKKYYTVLETKKWLFPFMQIRRWFRLIFSDGWKTGVQEMKINQNVSQDVSQKANDFIKKIGL